MRPEADENERKAIGSRPAGRHGLGAMLGNPAVAPGVSLLVQATGSRSWVLRFTYGGKRIETGLGGWPEVSVAEAVLEARRVREETAFGHRDGVASPDDDGGPLTAEEQAELRALLPDSPSGLTFGEAGKGVAEVAARRSKHPERMRAKWAADIERHCSGLLAMPVADIRRAQVIATVNAVAETAPSMARRVRSLIRRGIDFARSLDETLGANPADSAIDAALDFNGHRVSHHRAIPPEQIAGVLAEVDAASRSRSVPLALRFLALTATRSGEVRGARWDEIDTEAALWTIPKSRMKAGREHRVPLSRQALEILGKAGKLDDGSGLVFPSLYRPGSRPGPKTPRPERGLAEKALRHIMQVTGAPGTPHGFRASFASWAAESGALDRVIDRALAHGERDQVRGAYQRSDLLAERRRLMQDWADFIG